MKMNDIDANKYEVYKKPGTFMIETDESININESMRWMAKLNIIEVNETSTTLTYDAYNGDSGDFICTVKHNKKKHIEETLVRFQQTMHIRFIVCELVSRKRQFAHVYDSKVSRKVIEHYDCFDD